MMSRLPINVSAPLLIGIPVLALGLWLSVMWNRQSQEAVSELVERKIGLIHELASMKIADMVAIPPRICQLNEHLLRTGVLDPNDLERWRTTLYRELISFDMLSAITWGSDDGRSIWVARYADGAVYWDMKNDPAVSTMLEWRMDDNGNIPATPTNRFDFDLHSRPWYRAPRDAGVPAWSPPYIWAGAADSDIVTVGISFGIPLYDPDGSLLGVMDADFTLDDLSGFLRSIEIGKTGVAILASSDGTLLAASNEARIASADGRLFQVAESDDPMIAHMAGTLQNVENSIDVNTSFDLNGEPHYLQVSPVGSSVDLDWRLATIVPEADFLADIEGHFHRSMVLSIAVVIAVVLVAAGVARWLLNPLTGLVPAVRAVGQGNLDTRVHLGTASEYVNLGNAINDMTSNLEAARDREFLLRRELDHRVKNMLAQIVALCRQAAERATADRNLIDDLVGQVSSLSGVHDLLGKRGQIGLPMSELVNECCHPYLSSTDRLRMQGPDLFVQARAAMCLALVCNELATNARKYGALSKDDGFIEVNWSVIDDESGEPMLRWQWAERNGDKPSHLGAPGFGTQMLESLIPYEISGMVSMNFGPDGLRYEADMPLEHFSVSTQQPGSSDRTDKEPT